MFMMMRRTLLLLALLLPFAGMAQAAATDEAQAVVKTTVDQVIRELGTRREEFRKNPDAFYQSLDRILSPVVDFDGFARGVMTVRYSGSATPAQMAAFQDSFKRSLMQFYGNALLEYENQEIRMLAATPDGDDRVSANMEIVGRNAVIYPLSYTMVKVDGQWKLRNVVVNGINIGKLFRDQFADSMSKNGNSLDRVIAGWTDTVARARQGQDGGSSR